MYPQAQKLPLVLRLSRFGFMCYKFSACSIPIRLQPEFTFGREDFCRRMVVELRVLADHSPRPSRH